MVVAAGATSPITVPRHVPGPVAVFPATKQQSVQAVVILVLPSTTIRLAPVVQPALVTTTMLPQQEVPLRPVAHQTLPIPMGLSVDTRYMLKIATIAAMVTVAWPLAVFTRILMTAEIPIGGGKTTTLMDLSKVLPLMDGLCTIPIITGEPVEMFTLTGAVRQR